MQMIHEVQVRQAPLELEPKQVASVHEFNACTTSLIQARVRIKRYVQEVKAHRFVQFKSCKQHDQRMSTARSKDKYAHIADEKKNHILPDACLYIVYV